ncbi:pentapeptide repeat-containing protein [Streptomyces sp. S6]|nr:pentapeptide repeat-containing protein [Streptomyces sp. S6]
MVVRGAVPRGAVLRGAVLRGAVLRGAVLRAGRAPAVRSRVCGTAPGEERVQWYVAARWS